MSDPNSTSHTASSAHSSTNNSGETDFPHDKRVTRDVFDQYLKEKTFRFRPADYSSRYPKWPGAVGIEIEMFPATAAGGERPSTLPLASTNGKDLTTILTALAKEKGWKANHVLSDELNGEPSRLYTVDLEEEDHLSFEPGAQLEFSSKPYPCLLTALERLEHIHTVINRAMDAQGVQVCQIGMNPWQSPDDIGLQMPKPRYRAMTNYFNRLSTFGVQMMRTTGTVQVNLDFGPNEEVLAARFFASQLIAPFATAIFANSPISKNKVSKDMSIRSRCWQNLDASRTGFPKLDKLASQLTAANCVQTYSELALGAQVTFIEAMNLEIPEGRFTMSDWISHGYKGIAPTVRDLETHMSLLFPEVRARGFLELRSVDCQARAWEGVPASFYIGLLYDPTNLAKVIELLHPSWKDLQKLWWSCSLGLVEDSIAGPAQKLMELSLEGLRRLPACFKGDKLERQHTVFKENFTDRRRSPANAILDAHEKSGKAWLTLDALRQLDELYLSWN